MSARVGAWMALARLREHPGRVALLVLTLTVAVLAWQVLAALASPFVGEAGRGAAAVLVQHERDGLPMPLRHVRAVAAVEGANDVAWLNLATVACRPPAVYATLNAWGGGMAASYLVERGLDPGLVRRWLDTPRGIMVGAQLARRCGWEAGMVLEPMDLRGERIRLEVVGIFSADNAFGEQVAYAHHADIAPQLDEAAREQAWIIAARAPTPDGAAALAARIETALASSDAPVRAAGSGDAEGALARFGQVQLLLLLVMSAIALCASLVLVSVMAYATAERRATMAGLMSLGFRREHLLLGCVFEVLAIVLAGGVLGLLLALATLSALQPVLAHLLGGLATPGWAWRWLPAWLLALAVLALLPVLRGVARLRPTDWMRA